MDLVYVWNVVHLEIWLHCFIARLLDCSHSLVLTEQERAVIANREKDKGNEAFKTGDYEEAVAYYGRYVQCSHQHCPYTPQQMCCCDVGFTLFNLWSCGKTDQSDYWKGSVGDGLSAGVYQCFQQWLRITTEPKRRSNCKTGIGPWKTARRCWRWSQAMPKVSLSPREQDRKLCLLYKRLRTGPCLDY